MGKRVNLMLDPDEYDMLMSLADSPNKRGQRVGKLVRAAHANANAATIGESESLRLQLLGLSGLVRSQEARLQSVELQVATLIANDVERVK